MGDYLAKGGSNFRYLHHALIDRTCTEVPVVSYDCSSSTKPGADIGRSPRRRRQRFVETMSSGHPLMSQGHLWRKGMLTSQFCGSHASPHTKSPVHSFFPSDSMTSSKKRCSSAGDKTLTAIKALSRSLGRGNRSSHGWCFVVICSRVGARLLGKVAGMGDMALWLCPS